MAKVIYSLDCLESLPKVLKTVSGWPPRSRVQVIIRHGMKKAVLHELAESIAHFPGTVIFVQMMEGRAIDFSFLEKLPKAKSLYIDSLAAARNLEAIRQLAKLEKLQLGVIEKDKTNVSYLEGLPRLRELEIWRKGQDCEVAATLPKLESLHLVACKLSNAEFIPRCPALKKLQVTYGTWKSAGAPAVWKKSTLEEISLDRMRGIPDLKFAQAAVPGNKLWVNGMGYLKKA